MPVYILRAGDTDKAKIGWASRNVEARRLQLQAGCWEKLRAVRVVPGDRLIEAWLHQQFQPHRLRGDWFSFVPEMLTIEPPTKLERRAMGATRVKSPCCDLIERLGGHAAVAAFCSCGAPAISNWKKKGIPKSRWPDLYFAAQKQGLVLELDDFEKINEQILQAAP